MSAGALDDVVVMELGQEVSGPYAAKLLADLGARVIKVEPPDGDRARLAGPFPGGVPHPERSGLFLHFNTNKESAALDLDSQAGQRAVRRLARGAHILIENYPPGYLAERGLGYAALRRLNPALVYTSITHFGQTGPWASWQGEEIVDWAVGGWMYFGGDPARPPLMVPGRQAEQQAGMHGALASLAALRRARRTGRGQRIDVSAMEAMLGAHHWLTSSWSHEGYILQRTGSDLLRCRDGLVYFMRLTHNTDVFLLIGRPELATDPRFATPQGWHENSALIWPLVEEWTRERSKAEIYPQAQEMRIAASPVNTVADLAASPQMQERAWWLQLEHPEAGSLACPGLPYRFSATPPSIRRPAPRLGEHGPPAPPAPSPPRASAPGRRDLAPCLSGLRILELTSNWVGPVAGRHLADLGAEVIKVELRTKPATRGGFPAGGQPLKYHWNRAGYFSHMNRNKLAISLNLAAPRGRELFLNLVRKADVVIENNSARVLRNLRLEYPVLRERNPDLILCTINGFGVTGPERDYATYGSNIEATCGLASQMGYGPGEYFRTGSFYADPVAGNLAATAILAALHHRDKTGEGQHIDIALNEAAASCFPEAVLDYTMNGVLREPVGNRSRHHAPQGCYQCIGEDMWMVLCIRSDEEWARFCHATGHPEWAADPRWAGVEGRRAHHDELDRLISSWSREYDHYEAAEVLQRAGVPAAPVLANWECLYNEHAHARGFYVQVRQPGMGVFPYEGHPWKLADTPAQVYRHAPLFAEHNGYVFGEVLGLQEREILELKRADIIADEPWYEFPAAVPRRADCQHQSPRRHSLYPPLKAATVARET